MDKEVEKLILEQTQVINKMLELILHLMAIIEAPMLIPMVKGK